MGWGTAIAGVSELLGRLWTWGERRDERRLQKALDNVEQEFSEAYASQNVKRLTDARLRLRELQRKLERRRARARADRRV